MSILGFLRIASGWGLATFAVLVAGYVVLPGSLAASADPTPTATVAPAPTATPAIITPDNAAHVAVTATWRFADGAAARQVAWSADGTVLAMLSESRQAMLWQVTAATTLTLTGPAFAMSLSPDGRWLAAGATDTVAKLWDTASGQEIQTLPPLSSRVQTLAFSPDGRLLFVGTAYGPQLFWDMAAGRTAGDTDYRISGVVLSSAFSPDGKTLAMGTGSSRGGGIRLWTVATMEPAALLSDTRDDKYSVAFSPDGQWLASGSLFGNVTVWSISRGQAEHVWDGVQDSVRSVAYAPDGQLLIAAAGDHVQLYDVIAGRHLGSITPGGGSVTSVAFSPGGRSFATGSRDGTVRMWGLP